MLEPVGCVCLVWPAPPLETPVVASADAAGRLVSILLQQFYKIKQRGFFFGRPAASLLTTKRLRPDNTLPQHDTGSTRTGVLSGLHACGLVSHQHMCECIPPNLPVRPMPTQPFISSKEVGKQVSISANKEDTLACGLDIEDWGSVSHYPFRISPDFPNELTWKALVGGSADWALRSGCKESGHQAAEDHEKNGMNWAGARICARRTGV